jgi:hypothetical protein
VLLTASTVRLAGRLSLMTTPAAALGPLLVAVMA